MDYGVNTHTGQRLMDRIRRGRIRITWHSWSLEWTLVFGHGKVIGKVMDHGLWTGNGE